MSEHILDVNEASFESEVILRSHEVPVVVDFWAPWCQPCRTLGPMLERLAIEAGGRFRLAKVNVDENPNLAARFGVLSIPAVKAFRNGQVTAEFAGLMPENRLRMFLKRAVPDESETALEEGRSLLATRHWAEAEYSFRSLLEREETNGAAALGLLQSLLMQGRGRESVELLRSFPRSDEAVTAERLRPLADLLSEVEADGPRPEDALAASYYQAGRLIARGNLAGAMDGLIEILRQDKRYRGGQPKAVLLALFALLGDGDPLTRQYRDELASVLF
ncbi:MAG: tetratricopeptide repeat protein [Chloroflexota bacterium]